jgi:ArsR family transcriptional regulator, arsenate/arsenite/antimonite-responsive transcriptional repressor
MFSLVTTATRVDSTRAADLFHALADPIRVDVVTMLVDGERCVCDLMSELDLAQSRLSWHLKTLSDAGIISGRREGRWNYYSLNPDALTEARGILDGLKLNRRLSVRASSCD